ncbi:MAG: anaerobic ribonucleoside-triphosphate reductase activating protein [Ruminococcaceae bacterium]|nr:anaerobic ribonucleoside-triphosphate reductase activating protein [Oscillospiraceae bacterium]
MKIGGFQKMTVLDYPGKVACTVFLAGCNFRCPFCHNALLVTKQNENEISAEAVIDYLSRRKGLLDGVCITGGEPLLNEDIELLLNPIKQLGYSIKLDTNGSRPQMLRRLVEKGLVDYIAMDIKSCPEDYPVVSGVKEIDFTDIRDSIQYIMSCGIDYEFRTTVVKGLHTVDSVTSAAKMIRGAKRYYLQGFKDSGELINTSGLSAHSREAMEEMLLQVRKYVPEAEIRGL